MDRPPLPEPDISVPFLSEVRKVYQGDYYRADKVLPLLKQWSVLYSVAKAGHEQAHAEAVKSAADNAALREALQVAINWLHEDRHPIGWNVSRLKDVLKGASHG